MSRILVISGDVVGKKMAGPAIRCLETARLLAREHPTTLAVPQKPDISIEGLKITVFEAEPDEKLLDEYDIVIAPGSLIIDAPVKAFYVVDLYDPFILSNLDFWSEGGLREQNDKCLIDVERLSRKLREADFFICAGEKQRDFWLGMLAGAGRINPYNYKDDPELRRLIDVAPFGIPRDIPKKKPHNRGKGALKGIKKNDKLIIWAGGIWNWFTPEILVRAMKKLEQERPDVKLFFMGLKHPNPLMPVMKKTEETETEVKKAGLLNKTVFFGDWIPYEKRGEILAEGDVGVSLHCPNIETKFAFRTRILDYIWARLPVLCTRGDVLSEMVEKERLGMTVEADDEDAVADALIALLNDGDSVDEYRKNIDLVAGRFVWDQALKPLKRFCRNPQKAPDSKMENKASSVEPLEKADVVQDKAETHIGEINESIAAEQTFFSRYSHLSRIDVYIATFNRVNRGTLHFHLRNSLNDKNDIAAEAVPMEKLKDNAWFSFIFDPVCNSENQYYRLVLDAQPVGPGNAVTVWKTDRQNAVDGSLFINGRKASGSLCFKTYHMHFNYKNRTLNAPSLQKRTDLRGKVKRLLRKFK